MRHIFKAAVLCLLLATACKPEPYSGPLPIGNWKSTKAIYEFNGGTVAEKDKGLYEIISFYSGGYCCIKDIKGSMPYSYVPDEDRLVINGDVWEIIDISTKSMTIRYVVAPPVATETPEEDSGNRSASDADGQPDEEDTVIKTFDYNGVTINYNGSDYFYAGPDGSMVLCLPYNTTDEAGNTTKEFWYDAHTDNFTPYKN